MVTPRGRTRGDQFRGLQREQDQHDDDGADDDAVPQPWTLHVEVFEVAPPLTQR